MPALLESEETQPAPGKRGGALLQTTLFDLIAALQEAGTPEGDAGVVATVLHLLRSGRIRFLGGKGPAGQVAVKTPRQLL